MGNYMTFKKYLNESKITLYHGDNYGTHFISSKKMDQGNMQEGPGIYFSNDITVAEGYGSKIISIEADPSQFLNSRKLVKQERALSNNLLYILKDLWKKDAESMFYFVSDIMKTENINSNNIHEWASSNHFEISLQSIADIMGKYGNGYYEPIVQNLYDISKVQVLTNTLHKNKSHESTLFHLLRKISWVKDAHTSIKKIKVWIEPELLSMFLNMKTYYTTFFLQIQFGLKSKYSKLLYELLKDYSGSKQKIIGLDILKAMMNIDQNSNSNYENWGNFNRDILKRAVNEINNKSDIVVEYMPIKETINKRKTVTKVKFDLTKQQSILIDYSLPLNEISIETKIIKDINLSPIEAKYMELAQKQMVQAQLFGSVIKNKDRYLETIISNMKLENIDIPNMIEIDKIISILKLNFTKNNKYQLLVMENFKSIPIVTISSNYLLYSPIDKTNISETIKETINMINIFKEENGHFKIIETNEKISGLELSYL